MNLDECNGIQRGVSLGKVEIQYLIYSGHGVGTVGFMGLDCSKT